MLFLEYTSFGTTGIDGLAGSFGEIKVIACTLHQ